MNISFDERPTEDSVTLTVRDTPPTVLRNNSIAACLAPLHDMDDVTSARLMEWLELNRLLGIEHFVVYNFSCTHPMANRILRHYMKRGIIELVNWNPPIPTDTTGGWPPRLYFLHYYGQIVAENDCLYRLMHRYRWVQYVDFDEYLVPRKNDRNLVDILHRAARDKPDMFIFQHALFDLAYEKYAAALDEVERPVMYSQLFTKRHPTINGVNSKVIVEPGMRGETMLVHNVYRFWPPSNLSLPRAFLVSEKVAILHHYRFSRLSMRQMNITPVRDDTMKRYKKHLLKRLHQLEIDLRK